MATRGSEILNQRHTRFFVQPDGPGPENPMYFSGLGATYLNIESVDNPKRGGSSPIHVHEPTRQGFYRQVGRSIDPPDSPSWTVQFMQRLGALPRHLYSLGECVTNFYQVVGICEDLSDLVGGWTAYVKIYSHGTLDDNSEAGGAFESDDALMDEQKYTGWAVYNIGRLGFKAEASTAVYSEVIDVVYGRDQQCSNCGPGNDGTKLLYAVMDNTVASPGQAPSVVYSVNGGKTWTELSITGAVATDVPKAIDIVGRYLVVIYNDGGTGGYWYTEINSVTGVPGSTWTDVQTGFVDGPNDVWVQSSGEIFFCGDDGRIYKSTHLEAGVTEIYNGVNPFSSMEDLPRIHGEGNVLLVGGTVVYYVSLDGGISWEGAMVPVSLGAIFATINAVHVAHDYLWWVGGENALSEYELYYSVDQGENWTKVEGVFANATDIQDIVFVTPEVGYVLFTETGPVAKIATTFDGGKTWAVDKSRIIATPTADRFNRLAAPTSPSIAINTNNLLIGGLAGNGSDGIVLNGKPNLS